MNYQVLGVEYLTVSDSLPNQAHLREDLGTKVRLAQFPDTPQAHLILIWTVRNSLHLDLFEVLYFPELPFSPWHPRPLSQVS